MGLLLGSIERCGKGDVHGEPELAAPVHSRNPENTMTQTPITSTAADDIVLEDDSLTQRLDRQADAILAEGRSFEDTTSIRQAVREDAELIRQKVIGRVERTRDGIRDEPMKTTLYALGVGVLIGMLLRR
jgi:hypothetical protein